MRRTAGPISDADASPRFLRESAVRSRSCADRTTRDIDAEVCREIAGAERVARQLLEQHRPACDAVARGLFEREALEGEEVRALVQSLPERARSAA